MVDGSQKVGIVTCLPDYIASASDCDKGRKGLCLAHEISYISRSTLYIVPPLHWKSGSVHELNPVFSYAVKWSKMTSWTSFEGGLFNSST
jgi:hypothetical protein